MDGGEEVGARCVAEALGLLARGGLGLTQGGFAEAGRTLG